MPYKSSDIPRGTESVPKHGQAIYRNAFNAAYEKYGEERAHAISWAAVKHKFKKKEGRWVSKDGLRALGDYDPDQPRDPDGKWTSGGGGSAAEKKEEGAESTAKHPGKGYSDKARVDENGTIRTSDVNDAARALFEDKKVELSQPREVATLIQKLGEMAKEMVDKGEKAPKVNLCNVSVAGTNLFCAESQGIPRTAMPQLKGEPVPGSIASKLPADKRGEVDMANEFLKHLESRGFKTTSGEEDVSYMRATQDELNAVNVAGIANAYRQGKLDVTSPMILSRDNYILDGHHRWAGMIAVAAEDGELKGLKVPIVRVDIGTIHMLQEARRFSAKVGLPQVGVEHKRKVKDRIMRALRKHKIEDVAKLLEIDVVDARVFVDAWLAADKKPCPHCNGTGEDEDGDDCPYCNGEGYLEDEDFEDNDVLRTADSTVHLTDNSLSLVDGKVRKTNDGYLVADARIARTGIQIYGGGELGQPHMKEVRVYRPPNEVFSKAAMKSLAGKPLTLSHPPEMVDAANWEKYSIGHIGEDVARDGDHIRVPLIIMDAKAIEAYEKHGVKELSVGYSTDLKWGKGKTPSGEIYDAKQTAIRGNHLAVVPAARGGSRLRIGDDKQKGVDMFKILVDGQTIEFHDELAGKHVQSHISSLQKHLADAFEKIKKGEAEEVEEEEKKKRMETDSAAMKGEIAALKKQLEDANVKLSGGALDAIVKERTDLLLKADAVMDGKADFSGKEPVEIRRIVVAAKLGDAAKTLTDDEVVGAFKALTANIKPRSGTERLADNLSLLSLGGGGNQNNPQALRDAAYAEHVEKLTNAWKPRTTQ